MSDNLKLDFNNLDIMANFHNPLEDVINKANKKQLQQIAAIEAAHRQKEIEDKRKHEELLDVIRNSTCNISITGDAKNVQIQQNSPNSLQNMKIENEFDYEQLIKVLKDIQSYTELPQFSSAYGDNANNAKALIEETLIAAQERQDPGLLKKTLQVLKELTIGAGGSLIATGILSLLESLPF